MHSTQEFSLPAVAGVTDWARDYFKIGQCVMSIASNCYDRFGSQGVQEPGQQGPTNFAFFTGVAAVRHRVAWLMGVKRENVPEEDRALQIPERLPDHRRGSFCDGGAFGRSRQRWCSKKISVCRKVHFVGERKTCATPAAVPEIAGNPHGIYTGFQRRYENSLQVTTANGRGIRAVMPDARLRIGIENAVEFQCSDATDKVINAATMVFHPNVRLLIRLREKAWEFSPNFLKNLFSGNHLVDWGNARSTKKFG